MPHADLPLVSVERFNLISARDDFEDDIKEHRGSYTRMPFSRTEQKNRCIKGEPRLASLEELIRSFAAWVKEFKPTLLAYEVEMHLEELDHEIIWTPPRTSILQPIELC